MPPKQSGAGKPRPKAKRPAAAAMQKSATTTGFSDISDVDPFADSAEEDEHRGAGQRKSQQQQQQKQKQKQKQTSLKRGRQADIDMEDDDEEGRREHEDGDDDEQQEEEEDEEEDGEDAPAQIPPDLLTRLLHEFFERDGTRISRDANAAVARYMDVFVRETIARTAVEKESGFLEVEDLEKVAPQLLLDL